MFAYVITLAQKVNNSIKIYKELLPFCAKLIMYRLTLSLLIFLNRLFDIWFWAYPLMQNPKTWIIAYSVNPDEMAHDKPFPRVLHSLQRYMF